MQGILGIALVLIRRLAQPDDAGGHVLLHADAVEQIATVAGLAEGVAFFGAELMQTRRRRFITLRAEADEVAVCQDEELFGVASGRLELGLREGCFGAEFLVLLGGGIGSGHGLTGGTSRFWFGQDDGCVGEQAGQDEGGGGDDEGADVGAHG